MDETKGRWNAEGIVYGIEKSFRSGIIGSGNNAGNRYQTIRFRLKTSETNAIFPELYGAETEYVYPYNSNEKKSLAIPFEERDKPPAGYHVIETNITLNEGRKGMVRYDAAEYIYNNLKNGDSINVNGELRFNEYNGRVNPQYIIRNLRLLDEPIDFENENFREKANFAQEICVYDVVHKKDEQKLMVNAYIIMYGDKSLPYQFVVGLSPEANPNKKLIEFISKMKFGDFVKLYGQCINRAETSKIENEEIIGEKPEGIEPNIVTVSELRITGLDKDSFVKGRYKEEDFNKEEFDEKGVDLKGELGLEFEDEDELPF